jgi:hypothetical protein
VKGVEDLVAAVARRAEADQPSMPFRARQSERVRRESRHDGKSIRGRGEAMNLPGTRTGLSARGGSVSPGPSW